MSIKKIRIGLISRERIGLNMAGPAIRYFELAKALSKRFEVTLLAPDMNDGEQADFETKVYTKANFILGKIQVEEFDYIIAQDVTPRLFQRMKKRGVKYIADLYDPIIIEFLEYNKFDNIRKQNLNFTPPYLTFLFQLVTADHILFATERQKDLYLGILSGLGLLNPDFYQKNYEIDRLFSPLPFGLSKDDPVAEKPNLVEEMFPSINRNDKVIIWGGGIWNWFDPLTVIKAIEKISKERNDVKLVFMGTKHPNPKIKAMERATEAVEYCQKNGLIDKFVFFNFGWLPYDDRGNFLKRASVGVSTHFENLETLYSFRTRVLDYLWADLPMVLTRGDFMGDMVDHCNLGSTVEYEDPDGFEKALLSIIDNEKTMNEMKVNIANVKKDYTWDKLAENLSKLIKSNQINHRKVSFYYLMRLKIRWYSSVLIKRLFQ